MRYSAGEWRRVRFEGGIRPVALILHLEVVPVEREGQVTVGWEVDLQLPERLEQGLCDTVLDDLRANPEGERALAARCAITRPGGHRGRVQHADADAVVGERRVRLRLHAVPDRPGRQALDRDRPVDRDRAASCRACEIRTEAISTAIELDQAALVRQRAPGVVAHGDVDAPDKLDPAGAHIANVCALELELQTPGAQVQRRMRVRMASRAPLAYSAKTAGSSSSETRSSMIGERSTVPLSTARTVSRNSSSV